MKKLIALLILVASLIPILKVDYYNGKSMEARSYSVLGLLIQDIKDGTFGTGL